MTGPTKGAVELLNALLALEYDALPACDSAVAHLSADTDQHRVRSFAAAHEQHIVELSRFVLMRGAEPKEGGDFRALLEKGKVALGAIAGDQAILVALKSTADDLVTAYQRAGTDESLSANERRAIEGFLTDARAHSAWSERRLGITAVVGEEIMADEGENIRAARESRSP